MTTNATMIVFLGKECSSEPAEKRKCQEASHTAEIRTPYILPPNKTRVFNLMRRPRTKKSTKTKFLQDKIQYVQKKVTNVEELVAYLEKKNLLCEEGAYTLMVCLKSKLALKPIVGHFCDMLGNTKMKVWFQMDKFWILFQCQV